MKIKFYLLLICCISIFCMNVAFSNIVQVNFPESVTSEGNYYINNSDSTLYVDRLVIKFNNLVIQLPDNQRKAMITDIPQRYPVLQTKINRLNDEFGPIKFIKKVKRAQWGDIERFNIATGDVVEIHDYSQLFDLKFTQPVPLYATMSRLDSLSIVEFIHEPIIFISTVQPNDSYFSNQWYLNAIAARDAWDVTRGSTSLRIGIVDDGFDADHYDLMDKIVKWNGLEDTHGTWVAGVAAATTNNGYGIAGLGWLTSLDLYGGYNTIGDESNAVEGILTLAQRVDVINMSWLTAAFTTENYIRIYFPDCPCPSKWKGQLRSRSYFEIDDAIQDAIAQGVVCVASAGNSSKNSGPSAELCDPLYPPYPIYPAQYNGVIAVSATEVVNGSEQFVPHYNYGDFVDVAAPGVNILTTDVNSSFRTVDGTSFSAPQVSALVTLIKSSDPSYTVNYITDIIRTSAEKIDVDHHPYDTNGWNQYLGYGRINAHYAVAPPAAPQNISVTSGSGNHPYITWSANSEPDLTGYYVYRKNANDVVTQLNANPVQSTHYLDTDMEVGWATEVWYFVKAVDVSDQLSSSSSEYHIWVVPSDKQIVQSIKPVLPADYGLSPNYPNPFNPLTEIHYQLPTQSQVLLTIYNLKGQQVKTLAQRVQDAGFYSVVWDGSHESGGIVSAGTYLYVLVAFSQSSSHTYRAVHKMVYLK